MGPDGKSLVSSAESGGDTRSVSTQGPNPASLASELPRAQLENINHELSAQRLALPQQVMHKGLTGLGQVRMPTRDDMARDGQHKGLPVIRCFEAQSGQTCKYWSKCCLRTRDP